MWNHLTTPFLFARPGFELKEQEAHLEEDEAWRVLRVTFPADVPTHCPVQTFYFDVDGLPKTFSGILFPTRRRGVKRTPEGPRLSGITAVFLDYTSVQICDR